MVNVELNIISKSPHTDSNITGFFMLNEQVFINLKVHVFYYNINLYPHPKIIEAIINNNKIISFDILNGYNWVIISIKKYLNTIGSSKILSKEWIKIKPNIF